jgi:hypothetical protein
MNAAPDLYLPPHIYESQIVASVGLVSDTHMPDRCLALPPALFAALRGVDLLIHSGDVGELWVLDRLSAIAPVVAVHGNDDSADSKRELPAQQVIAIAGQRLCVIHGHYPDRAEELASRLDDTWWPKFERWLGMGAAVGAAVTIYGHSHIPMALQREGMLLVNPGAIASGNLVTRQGVKTVARLYLLKNQPPVVVHIDLAAPDRPFAPEYDWDAGFIAARDKYGYQVSILDPNLQTRWSAIEPRLMQIIFGAESAPFGQVIVEAFKRLAHRCWSGERETITRHEVIAAFAALTELPEPLRAEIVGLLR